jgi:hypothetical protein
MIFGTENPKVIREIAVRVQAMNVRSDAITVRCKASSSDVGCLSSCIARSFRLLRQVSKHHLVMPPQPLKENTRSVELRSCLRGRQSAFHYVAYNPSVFGKEQRAQARLQREPVGLAMP